MGTRVFTSHGMIHLGSQATGQPDQPAAGDLLGGNGLIRVSHDHTHATIHTGATYGDTDITVHTFDSTPPLHTEDWDDVVEVSLIIQGAILYLQSPEDDAEDITEITLPREIEEPQWWRVRIHARGRDTARALDVTSAEDGDPLEQHLLQMWPAPQDTEAQHKLAQ
ncbi:hypothetical protein ACH4TQ_50990 [Streptomyces sp. NPDC021218]|uniref:hypothetical protein n=1 Tax=Streptomyces sp. NPDC021218 TaxID=3365119 RepID=UPI0037A9CF91